MANTNLLLCLLSYIYIYICVFKLIYLVLSVFCTFPTWKWPQHASIGSVRYILLYSCQRRYSYRTVLYSNVCWPTVMYLPLGRVTSGHYIHIRIARDASRVLQTLWLLGKTCFVRRVTTRKHRNYVTEMYLHELSGSALHQTRAISLVKDERLRKNGRYSENSSTLFGANDVRRHYCQREEAVGLNMKWKRRQTAAVIQRHTNCCCCYQQCGLNTGHKHRSLSARLLTHCCSPLHVHLSPADTRCVDVN
jgi:hypothetical protein